MLTIRKAAYDELVAHAKSGYPNEACGLLAGAGPGDAARFYPMKNADESAISYFMDPKEQLRAFKAMRESGFEMRGIFHSHVASEAYPSQKDVRLAFYPDVSYLILSLSDMDRPVLRSYQINEEKVTEEEIKIV